MKTATEARKLVAARSNPHLSQAALLSPTKTSAEAPDRPAAQRRQVGREYVAQSWRTSLPLVLCDVALLTFSIAAARQLLFVFGGVLGLDVSSSLLPIATGFVLVGSELGLYPGIRLSPVDEFRRVIVAATAMFAMWAVGVAILTGELTVQRWFLFSAWAISLVALTVGRSAMRRLLGTRNWWGFPTLVCGDGKAAVELHHWLTTNRHLGLRPMGVIADPTVLELDGSEEWYLGTWSEVDEIATEKHAYWALVVAGEDRPGHVSEEVTGALSAMPHVQLVSDLTGLPDNWTGHRPIDGLAGVHLQQNLLLPGPRAVKRALDLTIALTIGLILAPILLVIALLVKLTSKGPILFGHTRLGQDGRVFKAWKFRTMITGADKVLEEHLAKHPELQAEWAKDQKLRRDPRITMMGRLFRKTSLDELPQLWNVLRGEMSMVGPRPIVSSEIRKYGDDYWLYSSVKPGITGLWQVSGRNNTTYEERVALDAYYVRNWSPWLDAYLLLRTVKTVLFAEGAY